MRSARLPVVVGDDLFEPAMLSDLDHADPQDIEPALTEVLQAVFAKQSFREGQLEALTELMGGRDCAVLLPTGGGKSLIYQMAGICKLGRTIVVDPLIALIEDQQRGLAEHGIDKVVGFSSFQVAQGPARCFAQASNIGRCSLHLRSARTVSTEALQRLHKVADPSHSYQSCCD